MVRFIGCILVCLLLGSACNSSKNQIDTEKWIVASEEGNCIGVAPMKCLLVQKEGSSDWEFLYTQIEGFQYEPGYEYTIEVKKETLTAPVAADRSSIKYILVKQLSKEKKQSENLPVIPSLREEIAPLDTLI